MRPYRHHAAVAPAASPGRDAERRRAILDAALACFLQFGYDKTSLDDIAGRADISRTLIYRKFRNKEQIFGALFQQMFEGRYQAAERAVAEHGRPRDKLLELYRIMLLEPWQMIAGAPMAAEFYDTCVRLEPKEEAKRSRVLLRCTQAVLGDKELADVFLLAVDGLTSDLPRPAALRRRLELLIDRFVA